MVNIKALIFVPVSLMTTAVMAQSSVNGPQIAEVEASASIALADMASAANIPMDTILQKSEKAEDKEDALEGSTFPYIFGNLCITLTLISENLGHILDYNTQNGVHCSQETEKIINSAASCKSFDELGGPLTSTFWPLALQGFKDTAEKINAQTSCLQ